MISIIIATYNSEATLEKALESVLQQKYQDWECIVIDGASKDKTLKIISEYECKDCRIHHISEPDRGIYDAFNKGWKLAKGEWIYYLGSDDELFPNALEDLITSSGEAKACYGDMCYKYKRKDKYKSSKNNLRLGEMISHQSLIMRRSLLFELGGFDEKFKICADYDLIQRCLLNKIEFLHVDTFVCKFNTEGLTGTRTENLKEIATIDSYYGIHGEIFLRCRYYVRRVKKVLKRYIKRLYEDI